MFSESYSRSICQPSKRPLQIEAFEVLESHTNSFGPLQSNISPILYLSTGMVTQRV